MELVSLLRQRSNDNILPFADALAIAQQDNIPLLQLEQLALANDIWPEPYLRHRNLLDAAQQHQLLSSTAAIIGCGGLGGQVFEELVRLGIGSLIVVDPDRFAAHNLNRQLLCTVQELGRLKVEAAVRRALAVNPAVTVVPIAQRFSARVHGRVGQAQVVLDCLDSVADRYELSTFCRIARIPMVHGAVREWFGQVGVQRESSLIENIYPRVPPNEQNKSSPVLSCTVATVASLQVAETVKLLLKLPSPLTDNWKSVDLASCEIEQPGLPWAFRNSTG